MYGLVKEVFICESFPRMLQVIMSAACVGYTTPNNDCDLEWRDSGHASRKELPTSQSACISSVTYYSQSGLHRMFSASSSLALQLILTDAFTLHRNIANRTISYKRKPNYCSDSVVYELLRPVLLSPPMIIKRFANQTPTLRLVPSI